MRMISGTGFTNTGTFQEEHKAQRCATHTGFTSTSAPKGSGLDMCGKETETEIETEKEREKQHIGYN